MDKNRPIGIFDSGIGGLTVAKAISDLLPNESLIYFGDTAHLPYGDKSAESVRSYSLRIAAFLKTKGCKAIVIACNTASARATKPVSDLVGKDIPVINVIDPVAEYVGKKFQDKKVGVIATKGTINSRVYPKRIHQFSAEVKVATKATPLLAAMIEEGFYNNNISKAVIHAYLDHPNLRKLDALILGCTHYPLIKNEVKDFYSSGVEVIDSSQFLAKKLALVLKSNDLLSSKGTASKEFYVSDFTESFKHCTRLFFGEEISLKEVRIWD